MNYWIITDTHFGHKKMQEYCGRPIGFEALIITGIVKKVQRNDVLIHLGDVCVGRDRHWHERLMESVYPETKKWLIRGNHDSKSNKWYIDAGWDCVCSRMDLEVFGKHIVLSHVPLDVPDGQMNIHGHFHNADQERWEHPVSGNNVLLAMEHHYEPFNLRKVVELSSIAAPEVIPGTQDALDKLTTRKDDQ